MRLSWHAMRGYRNLGVRYGAAEFDADRFVAGLEVQNVSLQAAVRRPFFQSVNQTGIEQEDLVDAVTRKGDCHLRGRPELERGEDGLTVDEDFGAGLPDSRHDAAGFAKFKIQLDRVVKAAEIHG